MLSLVLTDNPLVAYLGINPLPYHRELCCLVLRFTIEDSVNDKRFAFKFRKHVFTIKTIWEVVRLTFSNCPIFRSVPRSFRSFVILFMHIIADLKVIN